MRASDERQNLGRVEGGVRLFVELERIVVVALRANDSVKSPPSQQTTQRTDSSAMTAATAATTPRFGWPFLNMLSKIGRACAAACDEPDSDESRADDGRTVSMAFLAST